MTLHVIFSLMDCRDAGSDYFAYTKLGYPATIATEGDPLRGGSFPGDLDPYIHSEKDRMDVRDGTGHFSIEVCVTFSSYSPRSAMLTTTAAHGKVYGAGHCVYCRASRLE